MRRGMIFRMRDADTQPSVLLLFLVFLILGVAMTVCVAWASALFTPIGNRGYLEYSPRPWIEPVPDEWPATASGVTYLSPSLNTVPYSLRSIKKQVPPGIGNSPRSTRFRLRQGDSNGISSGPNRPSFLGGNPQQVLDQIRVGWPINTMLSLGPDDRRPEHRNKVVQLYRSGIVISGSGTNALRALPLRPRWRAFGMSAFGWGLVFFIVWQFYRMTGVYRRRRWGRLGACLGCGYAIEDLGVCPECGRAAC